MQEQINNSSMLKVGTVLRGTYRIDSYLSSGGFGNTYVATNIEFEERVAIKEFFMKGVTQRDDNQTTVSVSNAENHNSFLEQKEKFKKEARRLRKLKNEYIVSVHDLFEENGTAYYVMDYVDGENLAERLKHTGQPMSEKEIREILPQILDALKSVHGAGIWHLDLKPANIMLTKEGKVKLIDFGASKQMNAQKGGATTSTAISYTNGYAPREQMEQNYDKFGPWTDIYALGATIYTLLTNKRPPLPTDIDDDTSEDKHKTLPMPENTSEEMKNLILWMLHTNRNQRPQDVYSVYFELKQYNPSTIDEEIDESTIIDKSKGKKEIIYRCNTRFKNNQFIIFATLIAIIVCICFGAFYYWNYIKAGNNEEYIKPKYQIISDKEKTCELFGSFPEPKENDFLSWYEAYHIQNHACIPRNLKGHYDIPQKVDGYNIVKLGDYSFCNTLLSSINIPEGVKEVGRRAFAINDNLSRVSFSNGVESIGWRCFENDSLLSVIILPESLTKFGKEAFYGCSSLVEIKLPSQLTILADSVFESCRSLKSVNIDNIKVIGSGSFVHCESLSSISIPEGVEEIPNCAFFGCKSLSSVRLPSTIKRIKDGAFSWCTSLSSINIPDGVEDFSFDAFWGCSSLSSIHLPKSIQKIEGFFPDGKDMKKIISDIPDPFVVTYYDNMLKTPSNSPRSYDNNQKIDVLFVPQGTKELYVKAGWTKHFLRVVER